MTKRRYALSALLSLIVCVGLFGQDMMPASSVASAVFFVVIFLLASKCRIPEKRPQRVLLILLAALFSLWSVLGRICNAFLTDYNASVMREFFTLRSAYYLIADFALFLILLAFFIPRIAALDLSRKTEAKNPLLFFALSVVFMLVCVLPVFLHYYPGIMTYDTKAQFWQITGAEPLSNHHPVFHTLLLALPYKFGAAIGLDATDAFALVCACQAVLMALVYSYVCTRLYKRGINLGVRIACVAFYALMPVCVFYSITPWKDMPFAAVFVVFTLDLEELISREKPGAKLLVRLSLEALLMALLRNNAIYMVILCAIVLVIAMKHARVKLAGAFAAVIAVFFIFNGSVLSLFGVASTESAEYLAIPIQQFGRMAAKGIEFEGEDKILLEKLISCDALARNYHYDASDYIKFSDDYNAEAFNENKAAYAKLWLKTVAKHPSAAFETHLISTLGYWYPEVRYSTITDLLIENDLGIERRSANIAAVDSYYDYAVTNRSVSVTEPLITLGVWIWLAIIFAAITFFKRGAKYLLVFLPSFGVWLTLIAASPLFAGARYVYCILAALPVYFCIAFFSRKNEKM